VIAESTVYSSNIPTKPLKYDRHLLYKGEDYVEACIKETIGSEDHALVVMWKGKLNKEEVIDELMKNPFREGKKSYLTRLESRMGPVWMTKDIEFKFDEWPKMFRVNSEGSKASACFRAVARAFCFLALVCLGSILYPY
jgi:hypothetical protein